MNQYPRIHLIELIILVLLVTVNSLVVATTWVLLSQQDTKGKISPGINIKDL